MTLEERAQQIAEAVQKLRERGDDDFEDRVAALALHHLIAAHVNGAARAMRHAMKSEKPSARSN